MNTQRADSESGRGALVGVRTSAAVKAAMLAECAETGLTLSQLGHRILLGHYRAEGRLPDPAEASAAADQ